MTHAIDISDSALVEGFLDTSLPAEAFHHAQHVRCAWLFVQRHGMPGALEAFPAALRRFADAKGRDRGSITRRLRGRSCC